MLCQVKLAAAKPVLIQVQHSGDTHVCDTCPFISCNAWFASACSENMRHGNLNLLRFDSWAWSLDRCPPNPPFTGWNGPSLTLPSHPPTHPPYLAHLDPVFPHKPMIQNQVIYGSASLDKNNWISCAVVLQRCEEEEIDGRTILLTNRFDAVRILVTFGSVGAGIHNKPISGLSV